MPQTAVCFTGCVVGNAKAFLLETYHGLPEDYFLSCLDEFAFRFSRRAFRGLRTQRLTHAAARSGMACEKG